MKEMNYLGFLVGVLHVLGNMSFLTKPFRAGLFHVEDQFHLKKNHETIYFFKTFCSDGRGGGGIDGRIS